MGKGQKPIVRARVPPAWKDQIESICQATSKRESEVVQEALAQCLGRNDLDSGESLVKLVANLRRQMRKLAQLVTS